MIYLESVRFSFSFSNSKKFLTKKTLSRIRKIFRDATKCQIINFEKTLSNDKQFTNATSLKGLSNIDHQKLNKHENVDQKIKTPKISLDL